MDYIQGITAQTEIFLYALGFGFLLGVLYDVFRTVRMIISNSKGFVLFMDLLYFAVCTFFSFCFVLAVDSGRIRIYAAAGGILGWFIYYFSFGAIAMRVSSAVVLIIKSLISPIFKFFEALTGKIKPKLSKHKNNCKKNMRKNDKKQKIDLQKYSGIVYNLLGTNRK